MSGIAEAVQLVVDEPDERDRQIAELTESRDSLLDRVRILEEERTAADEAREQALDAGLDALDRAKVLEAAVRVAEEARDHALALLRSGTSRARAEAVLRAEGIEPIPAEEVARMRQKLERRRVRSNGQAAIIRALFEAAGLEGDGESPPPTTDDLVEVVRRLRDAAGEGADEETARLRAELAEANKWIAEVLALAGIDEGIETKEGDGASPSDVLEALRELDDEERDRLREVVGEVYGIDDSPSLAAMIRTVLTWNEGHIEEIARLREDLAAWQLSNVPRILQVADDQLAKVRALLDRLDRWRRAWGIPGAVPPVPAREWDAMVEAITAWDAAGRPLATEADRG